MPSEPVIGATESDQVNPGETFSRVLTLTQGGSPMNLAGATVEVSEANPSSILTDMVITITDAANGLVTIVISPTNMEKLPIGRLSWFRLKTTLSGGDVDVTPRIWIELT